jgi:hypothetical protein
MTVNPGRRAMVPALALLVAVVCAPRPARAQEAAPPRPDATLVYKPDRATLDRISKAALVRPVFKVAPSQPRFYAFSVAKHETFADYVKTWDLSITPITAPAAPGANGFRGGNSVDVFGLIGRLFARDPEAAAKKVRDRIDLELQALTAKR